MRDVLLLVEDIALAASERRLSRLLHCLRYLVRARTRILTFLYGHHKISVSFGLIHELLRLLFQDISHGLAPRLVLSARRDRLLDKHHLVCWRETLYRAAVEALQLWLVEVQFVQIRRPRDLLLLCHELFEEADFLGSSQRDIRALHRFHLPVSLGRVLAGVNALFRSVLNQGHVALVFLTALLCAELQSVLDMVLVVDAGHRVLGANRVKRYHAHGAAHAS